MMRQLFIAWVPFQRRSISMQAYFGYDLEFLKFAFKQRMLRPIEYVVKAWQTLTLFLAYRPQVIWVQLPPTPLLHLAYLYKTIVDPEVVIVADAHNATFRSPWIKIPKAVALLNRCEYVIVHNDWVKEQALSLGIALEKLFVLEDPPALVGHERVTGHKSFAHPWVIFPCSFNQDEPIQTVLEAARVAPEITFVLTGNAARAKGIHDLSNLPDNVKLAGFLPEAEFNALLWDTDAVLGLTKLDGIQLSVANEALGIGKPMVLSNTQTLKQLFHKGAVYVDTLSAASIAGGCRYALNHHDTLAQEIQQLKEEREKAWFERADYLTKTFSERRMLRVAE